MSASTPRVAVVTDSTAALPTALTTGLTVVPLTIVIDGKEGREGVDVAPADVAAALTANRPVTTSRPAPWVFVAEYERLLGMGYEAVLSLHLSAKLSGTWESAALAAADFEGRVEVLDSGAAGMGLGFGADLQPLANEINIRSSFRPAVLVGDDGSLQEYKHP